jgi:hypothetical protein
VNDSSVAAPNGWPRVTDSGGSAAALPGGSTALGEGAQRAASFTLRDIAGLQAGAETKT